MVPFLLTLCLTFWVSGVTDAAPRPITGFMNFYYDPPSQLFLMQTNSKCYLAPLTRDEKDHIHSHQGIEDLELTFVREWLGALNETLVLHTDPNLSQYFVGRCHAMDIYYINRNLPPATTGSSIIG